MWVSDMPSLHARESMGIERKFHYLDLSRLWRAQGYMKVKEITLKNLLEVLTSI
jgi:hypothetical protein